MTRNYKAENESELLSALNRIAGTRACNDRHSPKAVVYTATNGVKFLVEADARCRVNYIDRYGFLRGGFTLDEAYAHIEKVSVEY